MIGVLKKEVALVRNMDEDKIPYNCALQIQISMLLSRPGKSLSPSNGRKACSANQKDVLRFGLKFSYLRVSLLRQCDL